MFQINTGFCVTVTATTPASFQTKELYKFIQIRMMLHHIQHRTQQAFCVCFERIVYLLHLFAMSRSKTVNQIDQVLVLKHLFRHFILVEKIKKESILKGSAP